MSMYVELLSALLAHEEDPVTTSDSLLDAVFACRRRMLNDERRTGTSAEDRLADQIAYDRALVNLCAATGIDVDPTRFAHPLQERSRLEGALTAHGIDLTGSGRHRPVPSP
jgi:hypothetical protein